MGLSNRKRLLCGCLALACLGSGVARADEAALLPRHQIVYSNLLAARVNPLGLEDRLNVGYRLRLYRDPGLLWRSAYVGLAFTPTVNPAVSRVGGTIEIKPLAVLFLSVGYYFVGWHGSFEYLQSYGSPHAAHSDTDLEAGKDAGASYAATGSELQIRAQVLGKLGPVVLRNDLSFFRSETALRAGDRLSYNPRIDAVVADGGWSLTNDTDLVYLSRFGLVAGARASIVHAFYRGGDYLPGESDDNPNTPAFRLGPLLAYVFYDRPGSRFNKPTVLLIVNWYLRHRYRTGEDVHQAIPYIAAGFRFEGSLWRR